MTSGFSENRFGSIRASTNQCHVDPRSCVMKEGFIACFMALDFLSDGTKDLTDLPLLRPPQVQWADPSALPRAPVQP